MTAHRWTLALGLLAALMLGGLVWLVVAQPLAPSAARPVAIAEWVAIEKAKFRGEEPVQVEVSPGSATTLRAHRVGTVTASSCRVGGSIESGTAPLAINGEPVLALHGDIPWWRDVRSGVRGDDVRALHASLKELGHTVAATDVASAATIAAVKAVAVKAGVRLTGDTVPLSRMMWLPERSTVIAHCDMGLGDSAASDSVFAKTRTGLVSARLVNPPSDQTWEKHVLVVDGDEIPLSKDGTLAASGLKRLSAASRVVTALAEQQRQISASTALADPVEVAVIPPSAVVSEDGFHGCVATDEMARSVEILGSELGQVSVRFIGAPPERVRLSPPRDLTCG